METGKHNKKYKKHFTLFYKINEIRETEKKKLISIKNFLYFLKFTQVIKKFTL